MEQQAILNIGLIGSVSHGKSSVVKALTGIDTARFKNEKERNMSIKLGYGNCKIYKCDCSEFSYKSSDSEIKDFFCDLCGNKMILKVHISFVDTPGHESLMTTMLSGTSNMDAVLLIIAANEKCPQPQTVEHLASIEVMKLGKNVPVIILQNKIDLVTREQAIESFKQIKEFIRGTIASNAVIIPISAQKKIGIDILCKFMGDLNEKNLNFKSFTTSFSIVRSFDVNKNGEENFSNLKGGVVGGTVLSGEFSAGDKVEMRPGIIYKKDDVLCYKPIITTITSIYSEKYKIDHAVPGGLIGIGTTLDPSLCKSDRAVGQIIVKSNSPEPKVYYDITVKYKLLHKAPIFEKNEKVYLTIRSGNIMGIVTDFNDKECEIKLSVPFCIFLSDNIAVMRKSDDHGKKLIGWAQLLQGSAPARRS